MLIEIKDIKYEETAVYYRQKYEAVAVFETKMHGRFEVPIFFVIEIDPLSQKKITVELKEKVDYPSLPLIRALKEKILAMHDQGSLF